MAMKKRVLGRTGIEVSELALGGLFVTTNYGAGLEESHRAIHRAIARGINYIDTAPGYGDSETVIGQAIRDIEQPIVISTKLGYKPDPFDPQNGDLLRQSVHTSLEKLGREYIDVLMVHEADRPGQFDWFTDRARYDGPVMQVLDELKAEGVVKAVGIGGTTAYELANVIRSRKFDVVLTAFTYNLLMREAAYDAIPAAAERNMGIVVGSPFLQGAFVKRYDEGVNHGLRWLSKPRRNQLKALYALLDDIDMPITELALRFVLSNEHVSAVLQGAKTAEEVDINVAIAEKGPLPSDILKRLDEVAEMVPFTPRDEPPNLPLGNENWKGPKGAF